MNNKREEFYDDVISSLGGTVVDVELSPQDVMAAFRRAVRRYKQYGSNDYRRVYFPLEVSADSQEYDLPEKVSTIVKIIKPSMAGSAGGDDWSIVWFREFLLGSRGASGINGIDFLTMELLKQRMETHQKYFLHDVQFEHDEIRNKIRFLSSPMGKSVWVLDCFFDLEDEEYMEIDWIVRWTVAECKKMLGQGYRKFSGLAAPTGEVALAGSEMIQEAKQEQDELLLEIENFTDSHMSYGNVMIG